MDGIDRTRPLRRLLRVVCAVLLGGLSSGCISAAILGSGKKYEHLIREDVDVAKVRADMGTPEWQIRYGRPTPIEETAEYVRFREETGFPPWLRGAGIGTERLLAASCEVYGRKGPFRDDGPMVGAAMGVGCTFLVGEALDPVCLPFSIAERRKMGKGRYWITFWYDAGGTFLACSLGDIRQGRRREQ